MLKSNFTLPPGNVCLSQGNISKQTQEKHILMWSEGSILKSRKSAYIITIWNPLCLLYSIPTVLWRGLPDLQAGVLRTTFLHMKNFSRISSAPQSKSKVSSYNEPNQEQGAEKRTKALLEAPPPTPSRHFQRVTPVLAVLPQWQELFGPANPQRDGGELACLGPRPSLPCPACMAQGRGRVSGRKVSGWQWWGYSYSHVNAKSSLYPLVASGVECWKLFTFSIPLIYSKSYRVLVRQR